MRTVRTLYFHLYLTLHHYYPITPYPTLAAIATQIYTEGSSRPSAILSNAEPRAIGRPSWSTSYAV